VGDPFSFTLEGAPWLNHSTLFQRLVAQLHRGGGFAALSAYQALIAALLLALTLRASQGAAAGERVTAAWLAALPYVAYREVIEARPHVLGFVCLAVTLTLARQAERTRRAQWLGPIVPVYAIWAASHGSHILVFAVLALGAACCALQRARGIAIGFVASLVLCALLMSVIAPWAVQQGLEHTGSLFLESAVSEWKPLGLSELLTSAAGWTFGALWLLTGLGVVSAAVELVRAGASASDSALRVNELSDAAGSAPGAGPRPSATRPASVAPVVRLYPLLLTVGLLALALTSRRMIALLLFGGAVLWAPLAAGVLANGLRRLPLNSMMRYRLPLTVAGFACLLACVALQHETFRFGVGLQRDRFPIAAVAALRQAGVRRVYNAYNYGGYLMFERVPVFIDGRAITVYPPELLREFQAAYVDPARFERLARRYGCDGVLLPVGSAVAAPLRAHLAQNAHWQLRHRDRTAELYVSSAAAALGNEGRLGP
jgi:hypothetical protein